MTLDRKSSSGKGVESLKASPRTCPSCGSAQIIVSANINHNFILECDEMWSFVESKKTPVYIWLAIDRHSRAIVGCFIGDRTRQSARQLWASLPAIYQSCTLAYTDFWQAYQNIIPRKSHRAVGKEF